VDPVAKTASAARLRHVDFIRVTAFACVVAVHLAGTVNDLNSFAWGGVSYLMHFARYAFICVTAFVLFYGYYRRDQRPSVFYRRRFGQIVLPYLIWSAIYLAIVIGESSWRGTGGTIELVTVKVLTGDAWYHLYFLMITMQFYLVFPLLRWLLRRTEGQHGRVLAASWVIQLGYMALVAWVPKSAGAPWVWDRSYVLLPMYAGFVVLGALAAVHYRRMHAWVVANTGPLWAVGIAGFVVATGIYVVRVQVFDVPVGTAIMAMHPSEALVALAVTLLLYLAGTAWLTGTDRGLLARAVDLGSLRAFGVYAAHPLVIWLLGFSFTPTVLELIPYAAVRTPVLLLVVYAATLLLVEVLLRTPLSKLLVARDRLRPTRPGSGEAVSKEPAHLAR
jgi:peptidoglycan/LPS O-acetylase OafA/YrhL